MDKISFLISNSKDYLTTSIMINNINLIDILTQIEYKQLKNKKERLIIGAYEGISPFIAFHSHNHFLKNTISEYLYFDNRFTLLDYINTGIPGDHSVACNIDIHKKTIEWSNFKNFSILIENKLSYGKLNFIFERKQYERAINDFKSNEIKNLYS